MMVMSRPITLTIAVVLQWIAAIIGLIGAVGMLLGALAMLNTNVRQSLESALSDEGVSGVSAAAIAGGVFVAGLIVAGISIIRVIVAISLARGHAWARILITVFAILYLLGGIGSIIGGQWLTGIVSIVVELVILWLLWNSASSAYIKVKTAERAVAG